SYDDPYRTDNHRQEAQKKRETPMPPGRHHQKDENVVVLNAFSRWLAKAGRQSLVPRARVRD
ncbi:MAG: hypothetical protein K6T81_18100, partial [Alicyclobacillus macrosporangiidus]|uniref:hypothetical protein n=1 Tax=Alicyclobacillus macrosporangiidus TaxID=392015 RepID=UPI0026EF8E15